MSKLGNLNKFLLRRRHIWTPIFSRCYGNSTTTTGNQNDNSGSAKSVSLSYNSYETTSAETTAAPIIIMHGLFGSKQNWRSISKALHVKSVPTRKIFAVDARNHGESSHSPNHRYEDLAEDVYDFYHQQNISKAVVIGHSMGGRTMMTFALKYPELVEKAIIVDVSPITSSPALTSMGEIFAAMRRVKIDKKLSASGGRAAADKQLKESIPDKVTRDFILLNLYRAEDGNFKWRSNVDALDDNFERHIACFPEHLQNKQSFTPILFIGGSKSDYLTAPNELEKIRKIFPEATLEFLNTGHLVQLEAPQEFIHLVTNFINY